MTNGKIHAHFEDEITKLTQLDIPEGEALELVAEQFTMIFDRLFDCRQEILEYTGAGVDEDTVEDMVRSPWTTLRTHMHMEAFIKHGLKFEMTILASFIQFLTK